MKYGTLAFIAASLAAPPVLAEGGWIVGIIAGGGQDPYVGADDSVGAIPYIAYETEKFHIGLDEFRYYAYDDGSLSIDAFLTPQFAPDMPDTALFAGLERDDTVDAGISATYNFGQMYALASVQGDITGEYDGFSGQVALGYEAEIGRLTVDASAGIEYRDANFNNYLYGVSAAEATASRAAFDMSDTTNAFAEISATIPVGAQSFLIGAVSYADLDDAVKSPLVEDDSQIGVLLGFGYQF
ncbi:MAG: MipA/OmpV family protein [Pseudomonadota bacterium]